MTKLTTAEVEIEKTINSLVQSGVSRETIKTLLEDLKAGSTETPAEALEIGKELELIMVKEQH